MFQKLDFAGIAILITGSYLPYVYYIFYCSPFWQVLHSLVITGLGAAVIGFTQTQFFTQPGKQVVRSGIFIGYGFCSISPMMHGFMLFGADGMFFDNRFAELAGMGVCYSVFTLNRSGIDCQNGILVFMGYFILNAFERTVFDRRCFLHK